MLIHNKRLHPRRSCDHSDHHHGCLLHMESSTTDARRSISPINENMSSSLSAHPRMGRQRNVSSPSSLSVTFASPEITQQPMKRRAASTISTQKNRNSLGAYPTSYDTFSVLFGDTVDTAKDTTQSDRASDRSCYKNRLKSKSTICLSSAVSYSNEMRNTDNRKCYDSPDQIIANLFPGINDRETTFLRKGHGAVQMLKNKTNQNCWSNTVRSKSATGNYAMPNASHKLCSTGAQTNKLTASNKNRYRSHSYAIGGQILANVDRDFMNLRWVIHECYVTATLQL